MRELVTGGFIADGQISGNSKLILGEQLTTEILADIDSRCENSASNKMLFCSYNKSDKPSRLKALWTMTDWSSLGQANQQKLISRIVFYLLGPESVLLSKGYIGEKSVFGRPLHDSDELVDMLNAYLLSVSDGKLSLRDAYAELAIILRFWVLL